MILLNVVEVLRVNYIMGVSNGTFIVGRKVSSKDD
jgi:hypothetical protein